MSITSEITRIKSNIANAYLEAEEKGAILPAVRNSECLARTIESIPQVSSGWKPQSDWWDIDRILEEDTEDYVAKAILLMRDAEDVTELTHVSGAPFGNFVKCRTSDGVEYTSNTLTHAWDRSKDKECSLGYKTRYMIFYYNTTNFNWSLWRGSLKYTLYAIFLNTNQSSGNWGYTYPQMTYLQALKFKNCHVPTLSLPLFIEKVFLEDGSILDVMGLSLGKLSNEDINELIKVNDYSTYTSVSFQSTSIKKLPVLNTISVTTFNSCFQNDYNLQIIDGISFDSAVSLNLNRNVFSNCLCLREIYEIIGTIKIDFKFSDCPALSHDTLIRILNALQDYSDDTENTHILTLGGVNLAKLIEEEIAIATNKGWTVT